MTANRTLKVAIEGCCHGSLPEIYDTIAEYEQKKNAKVDLLLLCGDFQALRSKHDLASISVPVKYQQLGSFHQYYSGERVAPVLTIVIGGNHEASNYMWELYHGGWLAPNIYYIGGAGSVIVNGLRIMGLSGIFKPGDYKKGHFENVPFNHSTLRSVYHVREYDVAKLALLPRAQPSVFLSHDWPLGIMDYGDTQWLLKRKAGFRGDYEDGTLGSPPLWDLLKLLRPDFWFAGHLHVKFAAVVRHDDEAAQPVKSFGDHAPNVAAPKAAAVNPDEISISDDEVPAAAANPDEIQMSDDDEFDSPPAAPAAQSAPTAQSTPAAQSAPPASPPAAPGASSGATETRFLALDKCIPGRDFIQFLDLPCPEPSPESQQPRLTFDPEWLAISRVMNPFLSTSQLSRRLPSEAERAKMVAEELATITSQGLLVPGPLEDDQDDKPPPLVWETGPIDISRVQQFWPTAPPEGAPGGSDSTWYTNPQTEAFCGMLGIENKVNPRPQ